MTSKEDKYISEYKEEFDTISEQRKEELNKLSQEYLSTLFPVSAKTEKKYTESEIEYLAYRSLKLDGAFDLSRDQVLEIINPIMPSPEEWSERMFQESVVNLSYLYDPEYTSDDFINLDPNKDTDDAIIECLKYKLNAGKMLQKFLRKHMDVVDRERACIWIRSLFVYQPG
jgi:hypothetical protein